MVALTASRIVQLRRLIAQLREGEDITVFVRRLPEELHFRGTFLSSTIDRDGREWLDLEVPGLQIMCFELRDIYAIERHHTTCALA